MLSVEREGETSLARFDDFEDAITFMNLWCKGNDITDSHWLFDKFVAVGIFDDELYGT